MTALRTNHVPRRREEGGWLLFTVVILMVLVASLTSTLLETTLADERSQQMHETRYRAMQIAEAALLRAEAEIRGGTDFDGDGLGTIEGNYGGGSYAVQAEQDPVDPQLWLMTARGVHGLSGRRLQVLTRFSGAGTFFTGLFGRDGLEARRGVQTDSYDSRLGTYTSQATNWDGSYGLNYADSTGHVGSNGPIVADEEDDDLPVKIRGDAIPGPNHTVTRSGWPQITGSTTPATEVAEVPDTQLAEFQAAHDSPDNAVWTGVTGYNAATRSLNLYYGTLTLTGGTYFLRDLQVQSGAQLVVTGPVKLYVTQGINLPASSVDNQTLKPSQFVIYIHNHPLPATAQPTPGLESLLDGGAGAYLAIYAPSVALRYTGSSDLYGAIIARTVRLTGSARFHYDRALAEESLGGVPPPPERVYWIDLAPPCR